MRDPATFWERKRRSLDRAWRSFRRGAPEGVEGLAAALRSVTLSARAAGERDLARRARRNLRRLASLSTLVKNRELLARVRTLGFLPPEAAASLDARWEESSQAAAQRALRRVRGRRMRRVLRALSRLGRHGSYNLVLRLERKQRGAAKRFPPPAGDSRDRELSRYRRAVRRTRDLSLAIAEAAGTRPTPADEREAGICAAFDRWKRLSVFRRTLRRERRDAERRGSVTLVSELDSLLAVLDGTLVRARDEALEAARAASNVVSFGRRSA
jgi:hypothetical protein